MEPDETLERASRAFEVGDYKRARELALRVETAHADPTAQARVGQILAATAFDRVQLGVLLGCLALFAGVAYHYLS